MAEVEDFFRLREYDSLGREADAATLAMDEELARLKRREAELDERRKQLNNRENQLREMNHQMAEIDRRLAQHLSEDAKAKLEEEGLGILIAQQELENLVDEDRQFIAGYSKTLTELTIEINTQITTHKLKRDQALARAQALRSELLPEWVVIYDRIHAKKPAHGVFSRIQAQKCQFCRHAVSKVLESEVDVGLALKACPGCGRLFLPYKTVAG